MIFLFWNILFDDDHLRGTRSKLFRRSFNPTPSPRLSLAISSNLSEQFSKMNIQNKTVNRVKRLMPLWKNSLFANFLSLSSSSSSSSSPSSSSASTYSSLFATSRSSSSSSLSSDSFASTVVLFVFTITLAGFSSNWMLAPLGKNMELKNKD